MTDTNANTLTLAAVAGLVAVGIATAAAGACSPESAQIAAPLVAASPAACALLEPGSAERQVCDASTELARALERLAAERRAAPVPAPSVAPPEPAPSASAPPEAIAPPDPIATPEPASSAGPTTTD